MRWLAIVFTLAAAHAHAQEIPSMLPPKVVSRAEPTHLTGEAKLARLEGTVIVKGQVGADGVLTNATLARSLGLGLDEEAIDNASRWRFKPGTKLGEPVPVGVTLEMNFRALQQSSQPGGRLTQATFGALDGASRPVLLQTKFPDRSDSAAGERTLQLSIDETGAPTEIHAVNPNGSAWEHDLIEAVKDWKFAPARKDGSPVRVPAKLIFAP